MSITFLVHDSDFLFGVAVPALTQCWKMRTYRPGRELFELLAKRMPNFVERHRLGSVPTLFHPAAEGLPWDRVIWRHLVGEVLLYSAESMPDIQIDEELLLAIHGPKIYPALYGSHDILFGGFYRPGCAGYNNANEVEQFAEYLKLLPSSPWILPQDFRLEDLEEDRQNDFLSAKMAFPSLDEMYQDAASRGWTIVCEAMELHQM
jgi:hypothetical protein